MPVPVALIAKDVESPDGIVVFWTIRWPFCWILVKVQDTSGAEEVKVTVAVLSPVFVQGEETLSSTQPVGPTSVIV